MGGYTLRGGGGKVQQEGGSGFLFPGTDYSEAEALIITFSLNNYPADDPRMAQAKLWEEAFLKEMQSFQRSTADKFQIAFSAEVGALQSPWFYACNP